jgi:hypothetical protein
MALLFLMSSPRAALAGGIRLPCPESLKLQSDTIERSMRNQCGGRMQARLAWSTIMTGHMLAAELIARFKME